MEVWSRAPITLRAYAVLTVLLSAASIAGTGHFDYLPLILVNVVVAYFLLRGVRWLWWVIVVTSGLFLVQTAIMGGIRWFQMAGNVVLLVLLLLPQTRRYFFDRDPAPASA